MRRRRQNVYPIFNPYELFGLDISQRYMSTMNENKNIFTLFLIIISLGCIIWLSILLVGDSSSDVETTAACSKYQRWSSIVGIIVSSIFFLSILFHWGLWKQNQ
jgi:hypothetical protein